MTTAAAPDVATAGVERVTIAGMVKDRVEIWERVKRQMQVGLSAANLIGGLVVTVLLTVLVPVPAKFTHGTTIFWANIAVLVVGGILATVLAVRLGPRSAREIREWFVSGEPAGPRERELALRQPIVQMRIAAAIWASATVVFTALNAPASVAVAAQSAITIPIGGLASAALTYLLAERFTRPITAAALADGTPEQPIGPGVGTRLLVAWGLAAAFPLFGCVLLAVSVLVVGHWSTTRIAISLLVLSAVGLVLGARAMSIAGRSLVDPIEAVRAGQRQVQTGSLDTAIPVYDGSELGLLQAGFNQMTAGLRDRERIREAFGTYLDHEVAEHILKEGPSLSGEEVEVTAMFIDVRDFTGFAERSSAQQVVATINRLFERIVPIIHDHGGHVDKFVGDGLLAVFGAPRPQAEHADEALAAAIQISRAVEREFGEELMIGVGLSSGSVIAGNVGGAGRLEFSVIGDAVNVAARVEAATRTTGDSILIAESTRELLPPAAARLLEQRPAVPLKGKSESVALFAPSRSGPRRSPDGACVGRDRPEGRVSLWRD
jgi:adenylate cyclase